MLERGELDIDNLKREIGRGMARNGYGDPADTHKVEIFFITPNNNEKTQESINDILNKLGDKEVVLFAPENDKMGINIASNKDYTKSLSNNITIVPDAYTDIDFDQKIKTFPDVTARIAIARLISWYKKSESLGNIQAKEKAIRALVEYLGSITDNEIPPEALNDLNKLLETLVIRIKPIDYQEGIVQWQEAQKAVATSL